MGERADAIILKRDPVGCKRIARYWVLKPCDQLLEQRVELFLLGPGEPGIIDQLPSGRLYKDGSILEDAKSRAVVERRRMGFAGCVFVAIAMTEKGELADDPEVDLVGIPEKNSAGEELDEIVFDVVVSTVEGLPRARRRDADALAESVRRAVRSSLNEQWGKKPLCLVHVLEV